MNSLSERPKPVTLRALASKVTRLEEQVEDLMDLIDLLAAEKSAGSRPGIPWAEAKRLLDIDESPVPTKRKK